MNREPLSLKVNIARSCFMGAHGTWGTPPQRAALVAAALVAAYLLAGLIGLVD